MINKFVQFKSNKRNVLKYILLGFILIFINTESLLILTKSFSRSEWKEISDISTSVEYVKLNVDFSFNIETYKHFKDNEDFNYDKDFDILDLYEYRSLAKFVKRDLSYVFKAPVIIASAKADFINKYKIIFVKDLYPGGPPHKPILVFFIEKGGHNIYRFGKYEGEESDYKFLFQMDEIDKLNKIIKKEKVNVDTQNMALNVVRFFLVINLPLTSNIVDDKEKIYILLKENFNKVKYQSLIEKCKEILEKPMFVYREAFLIKIFTYYKANNGIVLEHWTFRVKENGEI